MSEFEQSHKRRYDDGEPRWKILYGSYQGPEKVALVELQRYLQTFCPYVIETKMNADVNMESEAEHVFLLGTPVSNPLIRRYLEATGAEVPEQEEGYLLKGGKSPWNADCNVICIAGTDAAGVLYGVMDFNARILGHRATQMHFSNRAKALHGLGEFEEIDFPLIRDRGIWTWGYPIYAYRDFIDNMTKLRMNLLVIWNDAVPLNAEELIDYAHQRGVRIVWGFHWGWGLELDISDPTDIESLKQYVIENYQQNYAHLKHDGIYFQTLTETNDQDVNGKSIAELSCNLVNEIGGAMLDLYPDLDIHFGLHAISILDNYHHMEKLDRRISVMWEDAGVMPYHYSASTEAVRYFSSGQLTENCRGLDQTIDYSKKLLNLRDKMELSMVAKGFAHIDWGNEFEHHGDFILGERSKRFIRNRLEKRQAHWNKQNAQWLKNCPHIIRFFREMLDENPGKMTVTCLVEDGMFEETIQPCVSMFAAIIWNPRNDEDNYWQYAMSSYLNE